MYSVRPAGEKRLSITMWQLAQLVFTDYASTTDANEQKRLQCYGPYTMIWPDLPGPSRMNPDGRARNQQVFLAAEPIDRGPGWRLERLLNEFKVDLPHAGSDVRGTSASDRTGYERGAVFREMKVTRHKPREEVDR